jgi:hypothetical protein
MEKIQPQQERVKVQQEEDKVTSKVNQGTREAGKVNQEKEEILLKTSLLRLDLSLNMHQLPLSNSTLFNLSSI